MHRLSPGKHLFNTSKNLLFEYVIHNNPSAPLSASTLLIIQCPAWGLGSEYLQTGLAPLYTQHNYTLLFFHPRGTDGSSRPSDPSQMSSMPHLASDLEDLRVYLEIKKFSALIGHSNGGAIALGYAEMYPERVQKLILLDHQLVGFKDRVLLEVFKDDNRYREAFMALKHSPHQTDEEFTRHVRAILPLYFVEPKRFVPVLEQSIGDRFMPVWCYRSVYGCDNKLSNPTQMIDGLTKIRAKTLMIFGKEDMICGLSIATRTKEGIDGAQLIVYDDCGHFPWIEKKEETFNDIVAFLKR
ncbi:hypothetical protein ASPWEDRAFT_176672 [Aspergillus wentii DTO 134E9]|uniref:AB hydrolase-1 domain-containing protein n=1 Tax=Aspergillus wentii DTO 134E9 TaxID=1073089 RepID=A0A1L9R9P3_ASPWE|nr:uncharacterized protein ASPWEDRAFT_176672 [Aspergillus wentii DTO 134E9]OJJ31608.1 hypothetical protein ASPWEDRAFT_176672 [Aspergillus wentii DTO 134E9]